MAKKTTKKKAAPAAKPPAKSAKKAGAKASAKSDAKPAAKPAAKPEPKPRAKVSGAKKNSAKPTATKPAGGSKKTPSDGGKAAPKGKPAAAPAPKAEPPAKASNTKKPSPGAATSKSRPVQASERKPQPAPGETPSPAKPAAGKSGRKGITIITPKPVKKAKPKSGPGSVPALTGSILGMGLGTGRPLIPSGPPIEPSDTTETGDGLGRKPKSPFNKRQLDKYREVLIAKRRELLGDINSMEKEALQSQSGSLSHLPQHMAEQGSETYEQSLSLDLAAADRVLLREIDAALQRIEDRTYGLCEHTGKPISKERLAELPWARFSIEAAREMERRTS